MLPLLSIWGNEIMIKKTLGLTAFLLVFAVLIGSYAYAGSSSSLSSAFDVSIDRVQVNGNVVAESKNNLIQDSDIFSVVVDFTTLETLEKAHVEAILRGRQSGDAVSNSTSAFDLPKNQSLTTTLRLALIDNLKRETEFDLAIRIENANGNSEQKIFVIKTESTARGTFGAFGVSIDRVKVNDKVVAASKTNFIEENEQFDVLVEFTALEDLEDAHVEAILKDLRSGTVIADSTSNFDLSDGLSSSRLLRLELFDLLKKSDSFELTVKMADSEGSSVQQIYRIMLSDAGAGNGAAGRELDVSIDSVELEDSILAENENNFVVIREEGKELDLTVRLTSLEKVQNAHIDAILIFESGDTVADATTTFSIGNNESAIKKLELPLKAQFEQGSFKLRLRVVDAEGDSEDKLYGLKISKSGFPFIITGVSLIPEGNIEAGKNLIAGLSWKNIGVLTLEGVYAKVSIPELGISSTKFVSKNSASQIREEIVLKVLDTAPTGTYTLRSEIGSQFGIASTIREMPISVIGKSEQTAQLIGDKLVINIPILKQDMDSDGGETVYPVTLKNEGTNANAYILLADGANWADLRLSEPNVFVLKPRESKTVNVHASSRGNAEGEQAFLLTIKSDDKVLKQITLKGNVIPAKAAASGLGSALKIALIGIVALLAAIGLFFGIKRLTGTDDKEDIYISEYKSEEIPNRSEEGEAYY